MNQVLPLPSAKAPPEMANLDAEAAFLGELMRDNSLLDRLDVQPEPTDFYEPFHTRLFELILGLRAEGQTASPVSLKSRLSDDEAKYAARLTGDERALAVPDAFAGQIIDLSARRRLKAMLLAAAEDCSSFDIEVEEISARLEALRSTSSCRDYYPLLSLADLAALPDPGWLVHGLIGENAFGTLYAPPKEFKSFAATDLGLHIAHGREWCGLKVRQTGVLYIVGEGASGISRRVEGWRKHHGISGHDAPFLILPVAVHLLDPRNIQRLKRTIDQAVRLCGFDIGLIIIDTVSRAIPGADENATDVMTALIAACDQVREHTKGAVLGVHHTGKDRDRGMRGNSSLFGAIDFVIRASRSGDTLTLTVEAQKDDEPAGPFYFAMAKVEWLSGTADEPGNRRSTLVPVRAETSVKAAESISRDQTAQAFDILAEAWEAGSPLSHRPETRKDGRYAPSIFAKRLGGESDAWVTLLASWLENRCLSFEVFDKRSKRRGLQVLERIV